MNDTQLAANILLDAFSRVAETTQQAVKGLTEEQLTYRPGPDANSITWLVWHLARVQDDQIAAMSGQEPAWTAKDWHGKFDLDLDKGSNGYGHTSEEVAKVHASADLLTGYYADVQALTANFINNLKPEDYTRVVDDSYDPPVTVAVRTVSILDDVAQHAGQADYIRGLLLANPSD